MSRRAVASLHLDSKNPRLGHDAATLAPREIVRYLFEHDKAMEVAKSIAARGYFPNEPVLAVREDGHLVVVEGNRRLAALKALREPDLLVGPQRRQLQRLSRQVEDPTDVTNVPVTIAPDRKATDQQIAGRHMGTPVLAWQAENRARFILDKLFEGYTNEQLQDELGFSLADIQAARQTRAIADMARSLDLPDTVKVKLDNPRAKLFTTIERVFDSSVGRDYLMIEPDPDYGIKGTTTKAEFLRGFRKLVTDVALGEQSSRTLNTNENIRGYFESLKPSERATKRRGSFVPADVTEGASGAAPGAKPTPLPAPRRSKRRSETIVPRSFKVRYGGERLSDIRGELVELKREKFPNAGAVLLRVFFELAVVDYLSRTGELSGIVSKIETKEGRQLPFGVPTLKQLVPEITRIAKAKLSRPEAAMVEKAVRYDSSAPFSISELHGFVHHADFPTPRDIQQFWKRAEPLFRLMLEQDQESAAE
jgi:hypothetical protein